MTELNFCYWLNGYIEIGNPQAISSDKVQIIKDHLKIINSDVNNFNERACHFRHWLEGFLANFDKKFLSKEQIILIKEKLEKVFFKVTPNYQEATNNNPINIGIPSPFDLICSNNIEYCTSFGNFTHVTGIDDKYIPITC